MGVMYMLRLEVGPEPLPLLRHAQRRMGVLVVVYVDLFVCVYMGKITPTVECGFGTVHMI